MIKKPRNWWVRKRYERCAHSSAGRHKWLVQGRYRDRKALLDNYALIFIGTHILLGIPFVHWSWCNYRTVSYFIDQYIDTLALQAFLERQRTSDGPVIITCIHPCMHTLHPARYTYILECNIPSFLSLFAAVWAWVTKYYQIWAGVTS